VLILVADDSRKMYARWSPPAKIVRRLTDRNYEVELDGWISVRHVNCLRRFTPRTEYVNAAVVEADASINEEDNHLPLVDWDSGGGFVDKFRIGDHLSPEQQLEMRQVLTAFPEVFSEQLGCTSLVKHKIELVDETPCVQTAYRLPDSLREPVEEEISRLLALGVIRESTSNFAAPMVPVKKASGELRITVNYKKLNSRIKDIKYPMSNPADILAKMSGKPWISSLDLSKSFFQIELEEECNKYTAFQTHHGLYEFNRLPMGLKTSPSTLEALVRRVLRNTGKFTASLLDDVIIASSSWSEHVEHIREVLTRLRAASLTVNISKCQWALRSMKLLGHTVEQGQILPTSDKVEAIARLGPAKTKRGVRAILGLYGYYRSFLPNFSETTYCLTELLKKNKPERVTWLPEHTAALETIKHGLMSKPVLVAPDPTKMFIIQTDATQHSVAAILSQCDDAGHEHVICYASRKLLPREQRYSSMERECCGIIFAVLKWEQWLYGRKILVQTDHKPLQWLDSIANHNSRLARWNIILQAWDIDTQYRKAQDHGNADGLSRLEID